jgi:polyphosphate kinase
VIDPAQLLELSALFDLAMSDGTSSWHLQADGEWIRRSVDADGRPLVDMQDKTMVNVQRRRRARAVR